MSDASTRGTLGIVTGPSGGDKAEAEQALLDRALLEYAGCSPAAAVGAGSQLPRRRPDQAVTAGHALAGPPQK